MDSHGNAKDRSPYQRDGSKPPPINPRAVHVAVTRLVERVNKLVADISSDDRVSAD
jgi:hypothetical protein